MRVCADGVAWSRCVCWRSVRPDGAGPNGRASVLFGRRAAAASREETRHSDAHARGSVERSVGRAVERRAREGSGRGERCVRGSSGVGGRAARAGRGRRGRGGAQRAESARRAVQGSRGASCAGRRRRRIRGAREPSDWELQSRPRPPAAARGRALLSPRLSSECLRRCPARVSRGAARRRAGAGGGAREAVASGARVVALRALAMWAGGPQSRPRVRGGGDRVRVCVRVLAHGVPSDGGVCACVFRPAAGFRRGPRCCCRQGSRR